MNSEKARELFSAYYEGSLDAGLKQQLERTLNTNADLNKEYAAFADVMRHMQALQAPVPEPPFDLHERITRKLDLHIHEQKARQKPSWFSWMRTVGVAAVAVLAIWGAVTQLNRGGDSTPATGGPVINHPQPPFSVVQQSMTSVKLNYKAVNDKTISVQNEDGSILRTTNDQELDMPVSNPNPEAAVVYVRVEGSDEVVLIALPGTQSQKVTLEEGKLATMAKTLAARFRTPIVIKTNEPDVMVKWNLASTNPLEVVNNALTGSSYTSETRTGLIWIEKN